MPRLHIMWDSQDRIDPPDAEWHRHLEVKSAMLSVNKDIEAIDIYNLARKLAEMLLEQL